MDRQKCIEYMIEGTKLQVIHKNWADSQINHLIKYEGRSIKRLAKDTNLPEGCVRRFKQFYKTNKAD